MAQKECCELDSFAVDPVQAVTMAHTL